MANDAFDVVPAEERHRIEKHITLMTIDHHWKEHLLTMDVLRQGIHFRGYAQKNPAHEYKKESLELFRTLLETIRFTIWQHLTHIIFEAKQPERTPVRNNGYNLNLVSAKED